MGLLRAGVLGVGAFGRHHARVLRALEGVDLVAVADPRGDRYQSSVGVPCLPALDDLLELGLDLCVVAVPTDDHEAAGMRLATAGVHTLIEKPLAGDTAAAWRIANAFEAAGLVGCVGHIERYNPALRALCARLQAGEIGEIHQIATRRQGPYPGRIRDVGVVMDLATHDLDLTAWVGGAPFASVAARVAHTSGRPHEDLVSATGLLADGTVTSHLVNWITPLRERVTTVIATHGCLVANTLTSELTCYTAGQARRQEVARREPLYLELAAFRDAVRDGTGEIVSMREGAAAVAAAQGCLDSAAKGVTVDLVW